MKKISYLILFAALSLLFSRCQSGDDFSSDRALTLSFSSDTVSFDTVFSTVGSATKQFKIYNRNTNSLVVETIELMNPAKSGFRMNIDGQKGVKLANVEVLKNDSLYGFIEVTVDPLNNNNPLLVRDSIRFVVNGNVQYVQLEAVGQDVHIWRDKVIEADTVLTKGKPFLIYNSLIVNKDARLSVESGVTFYMRNNASVKVSGNVEWKGTVQHPIVFRGSRFDNIEDNIAYDNAPSQWAGIVFDGESYNNVLENVVVKNAIRGMTFEEADVQKSKVLLNNVVVQNTSEYGVKAINCKIEGQNCLFVNSKGAVLSLFGGEYSFLHCTLANYYAWSSRSMSCLKVSDYVDATKTYALTKCDFANSIISGSFSKELLLDTNGSVAFNYLFRNCLIKSTVISDNHFADVIWNKDPLFKDLNKEGVFSYNFTIQAESPAINKADKSSSLLVPFDLRGQSRIADSGSDIGCYEWVE